MRLTAEKRAKVLEELRLRERYTMKAIARRSGISRQTLTRLRTEMLDSGELHVNPDLSHFDSAKSRTV